MQVCPVSRHVLGPGNREETKTDVWALAKQVLSFTRLSPHRFSQGTGGNQPLAEKWVRKFRKSVLGRRGTGTRRLNDCLVVCCGGTGGYKTQKGGQKERWWIPYARGAMKKHAAHTADAGQAPLPRRLFLATGSFSSLLPHALGPAVLWGFSCYLFSLDITRHGEETAHSVMGSQPSRSSVLGTCRIRDLTGSYNCKAPLLEQRRNPAPRRADEWSKVTQQINGRARPRTHIRHVLVIFCNAVLSWGRSCWCSQIVYIISNINNSHMRSVSASII